MFGLKKNRRSSTKRAGQHQPVKITARKLFHGVALKPGEAGGCPAVEALAHTRFLSEDAPMLPLKDCSNPQGCRCTYQHFEDRRTQPRRESDIGLPMKDHPHDARQGAGRRVTDG